MGSVDKTLFLLKHGKDLLIVQIYVDDIIFGDVQGVRDEHDVGTSVLPWTPDQTPQGTFVHQSKYTRDLLRKFEMADASPQMTPMSTSTALDADEDGKEVDQWRFRHNQKVYRGMIRSRLYLTATRPDIQFAVGLCARFQASPRESHCTAVKRILRYIKFTLEFGLWYSADSSLSLLDFLDSDHAGCRIDRKSTFGTCQFLGTSLVSSSSRKQSSVATSTCEAETKHIDVRYHFLRDNYEKGMIGTVKVASENQVADILTKPLDLETFARLRGELGVGEGVDKALIKGEIEGLKCTESGLSSWL
ncbi:LOW QUALITY PROTEIN: hypothetical protein U9M48_002330 [Paspalum notatum var. saurae]|uniref:Reverse transcriptase Ty1/copia-type domain-containing protein n=1 Tax=Paspalum notatum var. saurae TaxID=547442 RepID=A0AAQ3PNT3_PASNO